MLPHDFDLQPSHLQSLSNRDAIVALFAQLGYNTEARLTQTTAAMGFPATLAHEVTRIERIADQEQGTLQVYLIEMKRVTVALTQALARALRNRGGSFLLALTADYERIDFVLMELVRPEAASTGIGMRQAILRPRVLTIDRRDPGQAAVRVLRRFSYTEIDALYQWEKLRSAYGIAEWSEPFFNNRALFADYYLKEWLPDTPRVIGEADVFAIQAKVQQHILDSIQAQAAAEAAPTIIEPIQQTVAAVLKEHINHPTVKRSEVRAALRILSLPMRLVPLKRLKLAYENYLADDDSAHLLAAAKSDEPSEVLVTTQAQPAAAALTNDDLHLVCWEYVWS